MFCLLELGPTTTEINTHLLHDSCTTKTVHGTQQWQFPWQQRALDHALTTGSNHGNTWYRHVCSAGMLKFPNTNSLVTFSDPKCGSWMQTSRHQCICFLLWWHGVVPCQVKQKTTFGTWTALGESQKTWKDYVEITYQQIPNVTFSHSTHLSVWAAFSCSSLEFMLGHGDQPFTSEDLFGQLGRSFNWTTISTVMHVWITQLTTEVVQTKNTHHHHQPHRITKTPAVVFASTALLLQWTSLSLHCAEIWRSSFLVGRNPYSFRGQCVYFYFHAKAACHQKQKRASQDAHLENARKSFAISMPQWLDSFRSMFD